MRAWLKARSELEMNAVCGSGAGDGAVAASSRSLIAPLGDATGVLPGSATSLGSAQRDAEACDPVDSMRSESGDNRREQIGKRANNMDESEVEQEELGDGEEDMCLECFVVQASVLCTKCERAICNRCAIAGIDACWRCV